MMIKNGDFIELDYTGKIKDDKVVFDTTIEETAKASDIYNQKFKYKPVIICVGEKHLVAGLDEAMLGKNPGKYTIEVKAELAFGKKAADLLKLIPLKLFSKDKIQPFVGLEVNVDGNMGIVRNVSGGRVIVDFNHPLSGRDLVYDVDIKRIVTDPLEKVRSLLELLGVPFETIDIVNERATITTKIVVPAEAATELEELIKKLVQLKHVAFKAEEKKPEQKAEQKPEQKKQAEQDAPKPEEKVKGPELAKADETATNEKDL